MRFIAIIFTTVMMATGKANATSESEPTDQQIDRLLRQLGAARRDLRDQAEQTLVRMATGSDLDTGSAQDEGLDRAVGEAFLAKLPESEEQMPQEVQIRLGRIRQTITQQLIDSETDATRLTLSSQSMTLSALLAQVSQQTGNHLIDSRPAQTLNPEPRLLTKEIKRQKFWPGIDTILDAAAMDLYSYSGRESLSIVERKAGRGLRRDAIIQGHACYRESFRIEAIRLSARRGLHQTKQNRLEIELECAWEPRLQPIHLAQPAAMFHVVDASGTALGLATPQSSFEVEIQPGNHAARLALPMALPRRSVASISHLTGQFTILLARRVMPFSFDNLTGTNRIVQRQGSITVMLDQIRQHNDQWEIQMRLQLGPPDSQTGALASHRRWAFQNKTYLIDKRETQTGADQAIEPMGYETLRQNNREVGVAYFFKIPDNLNNYRWVYHAPTSIHRIKVDYALKDLPLP